MDPISITATCIGLASNITHTSLVIVSFVKNVRGARADLDAVSRELHSLKTVLELLAHDCDDSTNNIPQTLQKQISGIISNCATVVLDIEQTLKKYEGGQLSKATKWVASGKSDMIKLQSSLEAHKSALEIALDMVTLTLTREIKADTQELLTDTAVIKEDTAQILAEIARLQEQLPRDPNQRSTGFMLERYLDNLTSYAETVCDPFSDGLYEPRSSECGSIEQQPSAPTSRPGSRASSSESSKRLRAEVPDPLVFTGDLNSPIFEHWLLEMKNKVIADGIDVDQESKMAYIRNRVEGIAFTYLEPRLRPGCANPFTTGDEMFEVLSHIYTRPKPPPKEPLVAKTTSSPTSTNQDNRDQLSKVEFEGKQHSKLSYKPDTVSTPASAFTQGSTLDKELGTLHIQNNVRSDDIRASIQQKATSFPEKSSTISTNYNSTGAAVSKVGIKTPHESRLRQVEILEGHKADIYSVAFSPDGSQIASASRDGTIRIWADRQGRLKQVQELKNRNYSVSSVAFSPDGSRLASASRDGTIRIWADRQGRLEQVQELKGHNDMVYSVAFSPDGSRLASASGDGTIRIWADRQGGLEQVQELKDRNYSFRSVAFSPDGSRLASASAGGTIQIWADRQGGLERVQELKGHNDMVYSVAFSPDGSRLASAIGDGTIRIWADRHGTLELGKSLVAFVQGPLSRLLT